MVAPSIVAGDFNMPTDSTMYLRFGPLVQRL